MRHCTLIIPRQNGRIGLALKRKIHTGGKVLSGSEDKWNGWGGKKEWYDPSISFTAIREFWQESGAFCFPWHLRPASRIYFHWPGDEPGHPTMHVYVYFIDSWLGKFRKGDEMGEPVFFEPRDVPYADMMKGDSVFLPRLIAGERFVANMFFDQKDEKGLPVMEILDEPLHDIPWYITPYVLALVAWKKKF